MCSTPATVKRQKRLRLNSSDWVLRRGRRSLLNLFGPGMLDSCGMLLKSLKRKSEKSIGLEIQHMEHELAAAAPRRQEAGEPPRAADALAGDPLGRGAERHGPDRRLHLPPLTGLALLRRVLETEVHRGQAGRGVAQCAGFGNAGTQHELVHARRGNAVNAVRIPPARSEEHTSELQSPL